MKLVRCKLISGFNTSEFDSKIIMKCKTLLNKAYGIIDSSVIFMVFKLSHYYRTPRFILETLVIRFSINIADIRMLQSSMRSDVISK